MKKLVVHVIENCAECPLAYLEYSDYDSPWGSLHCASENSWAPCPATGFLPKCAWGDYVEPNDESFETMGENPAM